MLGGMHAVMVIGGGISGISAALDLAEQGQEVFLVERTPVIGGHMAKLDKTFPTLDCSICILSPKMVEVSRHPRIHLLTLSQVESVQEWGKGFKVRVGRSPRYVLEDKCTGCGICVETCPSKGIPDEFNEGLGERKAVYIPFPQAVPRVAAIDGERCLKITKDRCGACEKECPSQAIDYQDQGGTMEMAVSSVIDATGFRLQDLSALRRYSYDRPNVITALEYERMLNASGPTKGEVVRPSDGEEPQSIAFIMCAGSRDHNCREYCSKVCCLYGAKNALLTHEHLPASQVKVFHNDLRIAGKGHESFLVRASSSPGVHYIRALPGSVEGDEYGNLDVTYLDPETSARKIESFDMVVLFTPISPSEGSSYLAEVLGIETDRYGFVSTQGDARTSREGVFVCGCAQGPEDISTSVAQGEAAAALASARSTRAEDQGEERSEEIPVEGQEPRTGVYICSCGTNIGGVVDTEEVVDYASHLPGVELARHCMYACSEDIQSVIKEDIRERGLNRVLVAACSPRSHLNLFRETCREAGLNRNLVGFVSIREMDSWVHADEPARATEKAKVLVRMGVANALRACRKEELTTLVTPRALVIGGGLAGMSSALAIADKGFQVLLVEREGELGGAARRRHFTDLEGLDPSRLVLEMKGAVEKDENIEVLTSTVVREVS
ncbi:MAG: FAD-dependent oxidoreductase, partial [Methanomassiliicoccales archaeon]